MYIQPAIYVLISLKEFRFLRTDFFTNFYSADRVYFSEEDIPPFPMPFVKRQVCEINSGFMATEVCYCFLIRHLSPRINCLIQDPFKASRHTMAASPDVSVLCRY